MQLSNNPPRQLVLHGRATDPDIDLVDNEQGTDPRSFEHDADWIPRLGTDALLGIAAEGIQDGFTLIRFELADQREAVIDEDFDLPAADPDEAVALKLSKVLTASGADAVRTLLDTDLRHVIISGVELLSSDHRSVIIRRDGVVLGRKPETILPFLRGIWTKARLG